jgi:hypothetical protein
MQNYVCPLFQWQQSQNVNYIYGCYEWNDSTRIFFPLLLGSHDKNWMKPDITRLHTYLCNSMPCNFAVWQHRWMPYTSALPSIKLLSLSCLVYGLAAILTQLSCKTWLVNTFAFFLHFFPSFFHTIIHVLGGCGGTAGWGTVLQAERSRVQFQIVSMEFFIDIILSASLWP